MTDFPLKLERPLAVFDIESTGINRSLDRIIDLSILKIDPSGDKKFHNFRVNPGIPIPPETTAIHGIRDEDVKDAPLFKELAGEILAVLDNCDLAGFNAIYFDIPLLEEEFIRAGHYFNSRSRYFLDAQKIFHKKEPRDLSAALQFYCDKDHSGAHQAQDDVQATFEVIEAQLRRYDDLPNSMAELHAYCNPRQPNWVDRTGKLKWDKKDVVINFGKKQGQSVKQLALTDPGFLKWILKNDFPRDTKDIVRHILETKELPKESA